MVVVEARMLGERRALVPAWSVPLPTDPEGGGDRSITLRQLIERIVRAEVEAFEARRDARRFVRVLTQREIQEAQERGKIDAGEHASSSPVDPEAAVTHAWQAFEDGLYLTIIDGQEERELDKQVYVSDASRVVFLRLTFLAGG